MSRHLTHDLACPCRQADAKNYHVSAQNMYSEPKGAFTGETSPDMLVAAGIEWTLLGHSERRHVFGESDEMMTTKMAAAMERPLKVVACIGEQKEAREGGTTNEVCATQLKAFAAGVADKANWDRIVIAYEPVWAIGTGLAATPEMAQETHAYIRSWMSDNVSPEVPATAPIATVAVPMSQWYSAHNMVAGRGGCEDSLRRLGQRQERR